jgi:hypothetical protein
MELTDQLVIDATTHGSLARFLNHSCQPNCRIEKWVVGRERRVGVFSMKKIAANEELTFDYGYERKEGKGTVQQLCFCGAPTCQGYIGWRKTISAEEAVTKSSNVKPPSLSSSSTSSSLSSSSSSPSSSSPPSSSSKSKSRSSATSYSAQRRKRASAKRDLAFSESDCFICQSDTGELLLCDGSLHSGVPCAKVFHFQMSIHFRQYNLFRSSIMY